MTGKNARSIINDIKRSREIKQYKNEGLVVVCGTMEAIGSENVPIYNDIDL